MMMELVGVFSGRPKRSTGAVAVRVVVVLAPLPGRECCQWQQLQHLFHTGGAQVVLACHVFQDSTGLCLHCLVSPYPLPCVQIEQLTCSSFSSVSSQTLQNVCQLLQNRFIILFSPDSSKKQTTTTIIQNEAKHSHQAFCFSCRNFGYFQCCELCD